MTGKPDPTDLLLISAMAELLKLRGRLVASAELLSPSKLGERPAGPVGSGPGRGADATSGPRTPKP